MDAALREFVRSRAGHRCEYCGLAQSLSPFALFHIEHIVAKQHGGGDEAENLALACFHCNAHKGPNLSSIDPESNDVVTLFHPRRQVWSEHFEIVDARVFGTTPTGRATATLLQMNTAAREELRRQS